MEWAASRRHPGLKVERRALFGPEYAMAVCSFDINLAFLARRLLSRDLQTTRSVELPACGAFMLAQRTTEHQQLFREGVEAEFFSTHDELLNKCQYYLAHSEARSQIASAGRERCTRSDYSYDRQLNDALTFLKDVHCGA
jgi:spore maturation protein CgeB